MTLDNYLVWNRPDGIQELAKVGSNGGCNDKTQEVWNENTDGKIDLSMLKQVGGLVRKGKLLIFDPAVKEKDDVLKAAAQAEVDRLYKEKQARLALLDSIEKASSVEELRGILAALITECKSVIGYSE